MTSKAQVTKRKIGILGLNLLYFNGHYQENEKNSQNGKKIANHITVKRFVSRIYK